MRLHRTWRPALAGFWKFLGVAAAVATVLATGMVPATAFGAQGHLLMPYIIATKDTVGSIKPESRW